MYLASRIRNAMVVLTLGNWWASLSQIQHIFWAIAIVFSFLFLIQFLFSLIGLDFDDVDVSVPSDGGDTSFSGDFSLISVRSIIAFFTMFGWAGVLLLNAGKAIWTAVLFSSVAGFVGMFVVAYLMYQLSKLEETGTTDLSDAIFETGEVYLPIPPAKSGPGRVHVKMKGALKELDAITEGSGLPTGSSVRILEVLENNTLLVESIEKYQFE